MLHRGDMRMLQGGAEGGRVWLSQGLSGGDPVPVQEKEVCALNSVPASWTPCPWGSSSPFTRVCACVSGWSRATGKSGWGW